MDVSHSAEQSSDADTHIKLISLHLIAGAPDPMQGSQYTFRLVEICTPEPCKLVLMTDKRKRRLLCMVQVYKSCIDGLCTYQAFYRICCKQAGNKFTMLSGLDKQLLVKLGGLDTNVPNVATISLAVSCKALKIARVPAAMQAAFEDIRSRPNSMTVLAFPDHVLAPYAQPSPNPVQLQMTMPFPVTLPTCQLPADYKQRHGLRAVNKPLAHRAPFSQQLTKCKAWCTNPIQLDRPGCTHSSRTWENSERHIFLYLGYCHHYHQVSVPTMQLFLSTPLICHYVSFHIAAKHSHLTIRNFLCCAKRVLRWWQTKSGGMHPSLVEGLQWLQTLNEQQKQQFTEAVILQSVLMVPLWLLQLADQIPRRHKDPASLLAAGKWMSAPELVHIIDTAWKHAELDLQQQGVTVQTSRQLHDAALASVTFSHLPPIRLSCIRGLVAPSYQGPCLHPDCKLPGCEGNRLYIITTSPLLMRIQLPHHKNACKWGQASIEFDLPAQLAELLYTYLGEARRALLAYHLLIGQSCPYVFMDMHGRGFADAALTLYWQKWLVLQGGVSMNPSMCRQVFVDERASNSAAAGPSNQGAAMVMGHSEQQWHRWYDMQFHPRLAQNAVNSMQLWRTAMLQIRSDALAAAAQLSLSPAPHCRHVIVSDSESDCEEFQSCKSDSMEDSETEQDVQPDDDIELDLQCDDDIELDLQ
ncbi:TPA: hypothetical protein ACH3X2_000496 [Trebouxia sp. C0005]